jgi:hypothetical protein
MECSHSEFLDLREFLEARSHMQDLLREAAQFHKEVATPLFWVHALISWLRSPLCLPFSLSWLHLS